MDEFAKRVGARISDARRRAGMTQLALADAAGVPQSSLKNWETGRNCPPADAVATLAGELKVSSDWLLGIRQHVTGLPIGQVLCDQAFLDRAFSARTPQQMRACMRWEPEPIVLGAWIPEDPVLLNPEQAQAQSVEITYRLRSDFAPLLREWKQRLRDLSRS